MCMCVCVCVSVPVSCDRRNSSQDNDLKEPSQVKALQCVSAPVSACVCVRTGVCRCVHALFLWPCKAGRLTGFDSCDGDLVRCEVVVISATKKQTRKGVAERKENLQG